MRLQARVYLCALLMIVWASQLLGMASAHRSRVDAIDALAWEMRAANLLIHTLWQLRSAPDHILDFDGTPIAVDRLGFATPESLRAALPAPLLKRFRVVYEAAGHLAYVPNGVVHDASCQLNYRVASTSSPPAIRAVAQACW